MDAITSDHDLYERFVRNYAWQFAGSDAMRREAYDLRSLEARMRNPYSNIDPYDACAQHILLRHRPSGQSLAATRLLVKSELPKGMQLPVEHVAGAKIFLPGNAAEENSPVSLSEMGEIYLNQTLIRDLDETESIISLGMCLAAYALARLLFHDYLLLVLPLDRFKHFRASGLKYEYASAMLDPERDEAVFYLDLNTEIRESTAIYRFSQQISDQLAPFVNLPVLQEQEA